LPLQRGFCQGQIKPGTIEHRTAKDLAPLSDQEHARGIPGSPVEKVTQPASFRFVASVAMSWRKFFVKISDLGKIGKTQSQNGQYKWRQRGSPKQTCRLRVEKVGCIA